METQIDMAFSIHDMYKLFMQQEYTEQIDALIEQVPTEYMGPHFSTSIRDMPDYKGDGWGPSVGTRTQYKGFALDITTYDYHSYVTHATGVHRGMCDVDMEGLLQYYAAQCQTVTEVNQVQDMIGEMTSHKILCQPAPHPNPSPSYGGDPAKVLGSTCIYTGKRTF